MSMQGENKTTLTLITSDSLLQIWEMVISLSDNGPNVSIQVFLTSNNPSIKIQVNPNLDNSTPKP